MPDPRLLLIAAVAAIVLAGCASQENDARLEVVISFPDAAN